METTDTQALLQAYVQDGSEPAFRELVRCYLNLVYSTALRRVNNDSHFAEDVTQTVFADLARKASTLPSGVMLGGWLHQSTCFVASNLMRTERRRLFRETKAVAMNTPNDDASFNWEELAPVLDDAINELDEEDRRAVMLRFFEKRDFRAVGAALGVSDNTASKRIARALEKLRGLLVNHGVTLSAAALTAALTDQLLAAAPGNLVIKVGTSALDGSKTAGAAAKSFSRVKVAVFSALLVAVFLLPVINKIVSEKNSDQNAPNTSFTNSLGQNVKSSLDSNLESVTDTTSANSEVKATGVSDQTSTNTNVLHLTIVAADTGKPVANVPVQNWGWTPKIQRQTNMSDRLGLCKIALSKDVKHLQLTTRLAGFVDTRLEWWPERGETIPTNYTLKLGRGVKLSGRVLNEDNQPVEGAAVFFNCRTSMDARTTPESHEFGWLDATTGPDGRWQTDRIGENVLKLIFGKAYHSNYVESADVRSSEALLEWRNGTHVFTLLNPVTASGTVVDESGAPVAGATVSVSTEEMFPQLQTNTAPDGTFSVKGCKAAESVVTVAAEGFSFFTERVSLSKDFSPMRIALNRGSGLRLRVSNRGGKPLTNAYAQTRNVGSFGDSRGSLPLEKADAEGRIYFKSVPATNLWITVSADGYMNSDFWIQPSEKEHPVVLGSPLVVRGTVRDENGQPIPRFRVVRGWLEISGGKTNIHWGSGNNSWMSFSGGQYEYVIDSVEVHPSIDAASHPGHILRFEAEDHLAFISGTIPFDQGDVQLNAVLQRAPAVMVEIVLPNGQPAAKATVGLAITGTQLNLSTGRLSFSGQGNTLSADAQGRFKLTRDPALELVVVTHDEGFAEVAPAELLARPVIGLRPWGNVKLTYQSGGKPVAGKEFWLRGAERQAHQASYIVGSITDENGQFEITGVPPGKYEITRRIPQSEKSWENKPVKKVEVLSGETTEVHLGGSDYTVMARLRWPEGLKPEVGMKIDAAIYAPVPEQFLDQVITFLKGDGPGRSPPAPSPELRAMMQGVSRYPFAESANGLLTVTAMPDSFGVAAVGVTAQNDPSAKKRMIAVGACKVILPVEPATGTFDLGEIELRAVPAK